MLRTPSGCSRRFDKVLRYRQIMPRDPAAAAEAAGAVGAAVAGAGAQTEGAAAEGAAGHGGGRFEQAHHEYYVVLWVEGLGVLSWATGELARSVGHNP